MTKNKIQLNQVAFAYPEQEIFADLTLTIPQHEFIAIVGANGSGKTTLLRLISGLLQPSHGTIQVNDVVLDDDLTQRLVVAKNYVSVVLQNPEDQFVGGTVREDIAFGLENKGVPRSEMDGIIQHVTDTLKLHAFLDKEPQQLSGGQKQRVAIAGALAMQTPYLLFDEATSQLDPQGKKEVMAAIYDLAHVQQKTVVMITHDVAEILQADRVVVLNEGKIVADTTPRQLFLEQHDLEAYHLVLPEIIQYSKAMQAAGLINTPALSVAELVVALCK